MTSAVIRPSNLLGKGLAVLSVILGATLVVLGSIRVVPGDPIDHILGEQAQVSSKEFLAKELGLIDENGNKTSFAKQYFLFWKGLIDHDLKSFYTRRNTMDMVLERLPYTALLASCAMIIALILGPLMGIMAALYKNRSPDHLLSLFALIGISVPSFFLGPLLLIMFAIKWPILPVSGADNGLISVLLPALAMGTALSAMLARMSRASMLEVLSEDFIRTAFSKGLSPKKVFLKHALRNALIPIVTIVGLQFGAVLAGSVITEKIFNWPGIGLLLLEGIQSLDMPLVQTCVLVIALIYAIINLTTDLIYGLIDPRMRSYWNKK